MVRLHRDRRQQSGAEAECQKPLPAGPCLLDVNLDNAVQDPEAGPYRRRTLTHQPWGRPLSATLSFPVAVGVVKTSRL